ncbi:hypothetical protein [Calidifontibacillus oryziterrae]|uniref:hypothetical protein n=1 Tax=Calidifontibacillus oryziterrae TaxID=1191699 RepID=UPI00037CCAAA|nr:hypothetical protein [Calidifontibacillus oryziterrae]
MQTTLLLRILLLAISTTIIFRNRFKIMNMVLGQPWLRKMTVRTFMNLPYVRNRIVSQMFR